MASSEIDSKSGPSVARRIVARASDTSRDDSRTDRDNSDEANAVRQAFEALRDAAKRLTPGELTPSYERHHDEFDV